MNEFASAMTEDLPFPVLSLDMDTFQVSWANHAAQDHLGLSLKSLKNRSILEIFDNSESILSACNSVKKSMSTVTLHEMSARHRRSHSHSCDVQVFPTGQQLGVCIHYLETPKSHARAGGQDLAAMGRMLAHEIKNPLAGINGAAQLIRLDLDNDEALDLVDLIQSEIDRIRRLTDRMERLGDVDPGTRLVFNVHEALQQARKVLLPTLGPKIKITEHYDPSVPDILGDRDTLIQAMINLIKNAIESIQQSGVGNEVRLETGYGSGVRQRLENGQTSRHLPVFVKISDNGPGIDEHVRDRMFQPFVTSKPSGQGLGLALVSKIVAAHNGQIELASKGGWTAFTIYLPLTETSPSQEIAS